MRKLNLTLILFLAVCTVISCDKGAVSEGQPKDSISMSRFTGQYPLVGSYYVSDGSHTGNVIALVDETNGKMDSDYIIPIFSGIDAIGFPQPLAVASNDVDQIFFTVREGGSDCNGCPEKNIDQLYIMLGETEVVKDPVLLT